MADLATALISGGAALVGASIGAASAQVAAYMTRQADRRKRSVDRIIKALERLEAAYVEYVDAAQTSRDTPMAQLPVEAAVRGVDQSAAMLTHYWLRSQVEEYRDLLLKYYVLYGEPVDSLDVGLAAPTQNDLNQRHRDLCEKLRNYEK